MDPAAGHGPSGPPLSAGFPGVQAGRQVGQKRGQVPGQFPALFSAQGREHGPGVQALFPGQPAQEFAFAFVHAPPLPQKKGGGNGEAPPPPHLSVSLRP